MAVIISPKIANKLKSKHAVSEKEAGQCFENRTGNLLTDNREQHKSNPPTMWFIAPTNETRLLKVCFIQKGSDSYVRTVFTPDANEIRIYRTHGKPRDF